MQRVVSEHTFTESGHVFTVEIVCSCGVRARLLRGTSLRGGIAFAEAGHWAGLLGISVFRSPDEIAAGR